jgi:hypothetical protein
MERQRTLSSRIFSRKHQALGLQIPGAANYNPANSLRAVPASDALRDQAPYLNQGRMGQFDDVIEKARFSVSRLNVRGAFMPNFFWGEPVETNQAGTPGGSFRGGMKP